MINIKMNLITIFYKLKNLDIVITLYQDYISNKTFNNNELNIILTNIEENIEKLKIIEKPTKKEKNQYKNPSANQI